MAMAAMSMVSARAVKSNQNRIVFCYRIIFFLTKSNQIVCRSNRIIFSIFDTIRFDSIGTESWTRQTWNMRLDSGNLRNKSRKIMVRYFCHLGWQFFQNVANFFMGKLLRWLLKWVFIESNRFFFWSNRYRIKIKSNRKVLAGPVSKIESNRNQFDLTALGLSAVDFRG